MRLIDADNLVEKVERARTFIFAGTGDRLFTDGICDGVLAQINVEPTVDAVPVVRCREEQMTIYERALAHYGAEAQTLMMFEEMSELQKELCKRSRGADNIDAIAEEIADVEIMLEQMKMLHDCKGGVTYHKLRKLERLADRMVEEGANDRA